MTTLRRSCQTCVRAKRRCNLATPRCARCARKNTACTYINQPAAATSSRRVTCHGPSRPFHRVEYPLPLVGFDPGPQRGFRTDIPEVVRKFSPITIQQQISILRSFVVHFAQHGTTSFLHAHLYNSQLPEPLNMAYELCRGYSSKEDALSCPKSNNAQPQASQILRLAAKATSFSELVAYVQAIAFLQIIRLLEGHSSSQDETDDKIFWYLAQLLYIQAPVYLPRNLSPWRAWLFAESVRRTILVCHIILAVHGVSRRGYAVHLLCVEALPFDMRSRLWDAGSADAWEEAARATSCESSLVSLRQFAAMQQRRETASTFENLLLLSFK